MNTKDKLEKAFYNGDKAYTYELMSEDDRCKSYLMKETSGNNAANAMAAITVNVYGIVESICMLYRFKYMAAAA